MRAEILRTDFYPEQTLGTFLLYDGNGRVIFEAKTLELDEDGNKEGESCIPAGVYDFIPLIERPDNTVFNKESQGYFPYLVNHVPRRSGILAHHGNFYSDILGCILLGETFYDIDQDGRKDVTNSRQTMKKLNELLTETVELTIKNVRVRTELPTIPSVSG